ncbi:MAG: hypothetical protein ACK56F_27240, partial [bacterium]
RGAARHREQRKRPHARRCSGHAHAAHAARDAQHIARDPCETGGSPRRHLFVHGVVGGLVHRVRSVVFASGGTPLRIPRPRSDQPQQPPSRPFDREQSEQQHERRPRIPD